MRGNLGQDRAMDEIWVGPMRGRVAYHVVPFPPQPSGHILRVLLDGAKSGLQVPRSDLRENLRLGDSLE